MGKPIFSIRIDDVNPVHARVTVFNRGGNSGTLVINTDDLDEFSRRINGEHIVSQQIGSVNGGSQITGVKIGKLG